jgi:hypothetical protein
VSEKYSVLVVCRVIVICWLCTKCYSKEDMVMCIRVIRYCIVDFYLWYMLVQWVMLNCV